MLTAADLVETPPVWITSAPVMLEAGQLVHIHGWVRVAAPIKGSSDGLLVVDSLGGEALAQRFNAVGNWQEFRMYRAAPRSGPLVVTFALSGLGAAWLDDFTVQSVQRPVRALEQAQASRPPVALRGGAARTR